MKKVKVLVADSNYLTRKGVVTLVENNSDFIVAAEACTHDELVEKIKLYNPTLVVIDYASETFSVDSISYIKKNHPSINILAITNNLPATIMSKALSKGVVSHLLKDCDFDEITEALYKTSEGIKFLCGKIVDVLIVDKESIVKQTTFASCEGINITDREMEIVQLIAQGFSNKEIAEKLFLSTHTVTTHRKNIMAKLGVNNTAGVVMYAVRHNATTPNKFLFS